VASSVLLRESKYMLTFVLDTIEGYARAHTSNESSLLRKLFNETLAKTKLPNMSIGHLEGTFLRFLVRAIKAKRILEIGTFTGYSALAMAEVLPDDGEVITLDIDPKATDIARLYWSNSSHEKKIKLILGDAKETLKTINGPFDLIFMFQICIIKCHWYQLVQFKYLRGTGAVYKNYIDVICEVYHDLPTCSARRDKLLSV